MLVFNSIFDFTVDRLEFLGKFCSFLGFRDLKQIEKCGSTRMTTAHVYYAPRLISTS